MGMDDTKRGREAEPRWAHNPENPGSNPGLATEDPQAHEPRGQLLGPDLACAYSDPIEHLRPHDWKSIPGLPRLTEYTITPVFVPITIPALDVPASLLRAEEPAGLSYPYYYGLVNDRYPR